MPATRIKGKRDNPQIPYRLVMVEWEDSQRPIPTWEWLDDYKVPEIVRCVSVGYLIADHKKAIALAPNLGNLTSEVATASGIIRIPRHAIQRITRL